MKIGCCKKCYTNYTSDDYPAQFYDACYNPSCECHRNTEWHPNGVECDNKCHYAEPYGFVPESGCKIHDR